MWCILLHFTQFCIRRQVRHPPYGPWEHVPPHVWTDQSNSAATQDEAEDEAEVCVLCYQRRSIDTKHDMQTGGHVNHKKNHILPVETSSGLLRETGSVCHFFWLEDLL